LMPHTYAFIYLTYTHLLTCPSQVFDGIDVVTGGVTIDDDGFLKLIKVINPGYNYSETPNILIDAPYMNSSCHLCCKDTS
jgi:hypothetical protein